MKIGPEMKRYAQPEPGQLYALSAHDVVELLGWRPDTQIELSAKEGYALIFVLEEPVRFVETEWLTAEQAEEMNVALEQRCAEWDEQQERAQG